MTIQEAISNEKKAQPFSAQCPSREILELIGGKWSLLTLCLLKSGPMRTNLIMHSIQGISQKMLTQTLRDLKRAGLVERRSYSEVPPRVEYSLTPLGATLSVVVLQLEHWVVDHYEQVVAAQALLDTHQSE